MSRDISDVPTRVRILGSLILPVSFVMSQTLDGEISGLMKAVDDGSTSYSITPGVRYVPRFSVGFSETERGRFDFEISANLSASEIRREASAYRLWVRYSTHRFESRLGLQKIDFGPAKLLRSLRWFDRLDPQDPLQLAEGVYGLRLRYVFQNNANIWLWSLYGNEGTKGIEFIPAEENSPEYGGRFQYRVGNGEMALTTHSRVIDFSGKRISEKRIALDGVWDAGIGVLLESAWIEKDANWQSFTTLGADYTFGVGNGLTVLCEHLLFSADDTRKNMTGLMMLYPLSLMDQLSYFSFYSWNENLPYHYFSWQRNYDVWIWHLSVFWSRTGNRSTGESQSITGFGRKGIQLMFIFNH